MSSRLVMTKLKSSDDNNDEQIYYSIDDKQSFITISGDLNFTMAGVFFNVLNKFEAKHIRRPLKIYINSEGGDFFAATKIYDHIRHSPCPIVTIGSGVVFSGAIIVFLAGDLRWALPNSVFGFHWPIRNTEGEENPDETKLAAEWHKSFFESIMDIAQERTKIYNRMLLRELFKTAKIFDAQTAVKYGVAHQVIEPVKKQLPRNWKKFTKP
ncbi:MAG: ATP-dependent Clp protease proteolytic subunit [Candidatus Azambacteria bacterium]|nr:ATP-dependent Clp protease proteolytic subunit [Candidatus Azambacteria bacterium]